MDTGIEQEWQVAISAIEHYAYCPRQCALIHVEGIFEENRYTVRGNITHERVHDGDDAALRGVPVHRGLRIYCDRLGLVGQADLVEMRPEGPYPVEYKSGRLHRTPAELQLCAQALCLEEMYGVAVPCGAIYHAGARNRREVKLTAALRQHTEQVVSAVRDMLRRGYVPPPTDNPALCMRCSLVDTCLPDVVREKPRLRGVQSVLFRVHDAEEGDA
jgi:CRISPR-associated exonuclease Cas4